MSRIPFVTENVIDFSTDINESLRIADGLIPSRVTHMQTTSPSAPTDGQRVAVASGGSGHFTGHDGELAIYVAQGEFWQFYEPVLCVFNNALYISTGSDWVAA